MPRRGMRGRRALRPAPDGLGEEAPASQDVVAVGAHLGPRDDELVGAGGGIARELGGRGLDVVAEQRIALGTGREPRREDARDDPAGGAAGACAQLAVADDGLTELGRAAG
jgi:hypothetical protein